MEIRIRVTDKTGHSEVVCGNALEAKQVISQHESDGKWCYVDGNYVKSGTLSNADVERAGDILLANALVGGA